LRGIEADDEFFEFEFSRASCDARRHCVKGNGLGKGPQILKDCP
jgi:hypothetical protein